MLESARANGACLQWCMPSWRVEHVNICKMSMSMMNSFWTNDELEYVLFILGKRDTPASAR